MFCIVGVLHFSSVLSRSLFAASSCLRSPRVPASPCPRISASPVSFSVSQLPRLNRVNRMNQHNQFQNQAVSDPKQEYDFRRDKDRQRAQPTELARNEHPDTTTQDIANRIHHCITTITKKCRGRAIPIDYRICVLENLPRRLSRQHNGETPPGRDILLEDITKEQQKDSRKHESVHQVRKAVGIQECL